MTPVIKTLRRVLPGILITWMLPAAAETLTLRQAESLALDNDAGYTSLVKQSVAIEENAVAASQLPDPMVSVGWLNLPVEDFNLHQEPMNQVKVGIKQTFPAGDSLAIAKRSALAQADATRETASGRRLEVLMQTRDTWLEVQYQQAALAVVLGNEPLFEQLRDITATLYRTGKKALNDVVRAELEVQRLKDRELGIRENIEKQRATLARWTGPIALNADVPTASPDWKFDITNRTTLSHRLLMHPAIQAMDKKVEQMREQVALARQQYKPAWSLEAAYSFRNAQRGNGDDVSNLVSIGASMNLPLFTKNRQDKRVDAATAQLNAKLDQRNDLLKALGAKLETKLIRMDRLNDRIALHKSMIVPQSNEQASAALMAYRADRADFAEVMRANMASLESQLTLRRLQTDRLETIADIWYLLPPATDMDKTHEQ